MMTDQEIEAMQAENAAWEAETRALLAKLGGFALKNVEVEGGTPGDGLRANLAVSVEAMAINFAQMRAHYGVVLPWERKIDAAKPA